jgi:hypothetical protein
VFQEINREYFRGRLARRHAQNGGVLLDRRENTSLAEVRRPLRHKSCHVFVDREEAEEHGPKLSVDIALLKFCKQLHRFQFLVRLHEESNALLALSLIQMLRESVDVSVPEFFTRFQVWGAFEDGNHFVRQFVASILAHVRFRRIVSLTG